MKTYFFLSVSTSVAILIASCDPQLKDIAVVKLYNNSTDTIMAYNEAKSVEDSMLYVMSSVPAGILTIKPGSYGEFDLQAIDKSNFEDGDYVIRYYFFNPDTVRNVSWERIAKENILLKRVDIYSWQQLEDMNFEINYP
jgi:hypothetical protein